MLKVDENMSNSVALNAEGYLEPCPSEETDGATFKGVKDV